jgi:lysophospholipase L1-like esterase
VKRLIALMAVLVVAVSVLGLVTTQPTQVRSKKTVVFVGDSISYISGGAIGYAFRHGYTVEFEAGVGKTMAEMLPAVKMLASAHPWAFVVELGTNDALYDIPGWKAAFANEENALASQRCVVFITVTPKGPVRAGVNAAIAAAVKTHSNFHALDWGAVGYGEPAWVEPDGIHPTAAGQKELATLELAAVRKDCRR